MDNLNNINSTNSNINITFILNKIIKVTFNRSIHSHNKVNNRKIHSKTNHFLMLTRRNLNLIKKIDRYLFKISKYWGFGVWFWGFGTKNK